MKVQVKVFRGRDFNERCPEDYQTFEYTGDEKMSVAQLLYELNSKERLVDIHGKACEKISWECSCFVKKCGACAMRINGIPRLACSFFLHELKSPEITLEPLSKFPIVKDLTVDRSFIFESLKEISLWLEGNARMKPETHEYRYGSAKCLMCGCCLEVCPNFRVGGRFTGAVTPVNMYRILDEQEKNGHRKDMKRSYSKSYYEGCGKSLSCRDICPAGIPVDDLIARSNAAAVWGRG